MATTPAKIGRDLSALQARVAGQVILPGDRGWSEATRTGILPISHRPAAVVMVADVDDVVAVVGFARAHGLRIAVQHTGQDAWSPPPIGDAIVVSTAPLRHVEIDADTWRAHIEAGALWPDVIEPAAEQGLVVLHPTAPQGGLIASTLNGGIGWMARSHGLAAHSVSAVEIVTADGTLVWADHETEPDLFWAVRGGGGFGVVTAIEIELFETPALYAGTMCWPLKRARDVLRAWRRWLATVPDELTSVGRIVHTPPEADSFVAIEAVFAGPERVGAELVAPLRNLGPSIDTFATVTPSALRALGLNSPSGSRAREAILLDQLPVDAIDAIVEIAARPLTMLEVQHLGGVLARPSPRHGAAATIAAEFVVFATGADAFGRVKAAMASWEATRVSVSAPERPIDPARLCPADSSERLRRVRAVYDPARLFVGHHPIALPGRTGTD